jgi:hypothetical protein
MLLLAELSFTDTNRSYFPLVQPSQGIGEEEKKDTEKKHGR